MSNLFTRLKNTIVADLNEALEQKENKNPIAMLNQYLRECELETEKVRKLVERQYTLRDGFTREWKHAQELAEKRKYQAEVAQNAGETELYTFASAEQLQYEERAARLSESLRYTENQLQELEQKYEEMKHKLKDMHIRRMELMGRENLSRAHYQMNKVLDNDNYSNSSVSRFQEIESYLDRMEEKINSSYYRNTIDARIAKLEKEMKKEEATTL
ncbi:PspA/IM30 family protein [Robertmurraya korlensis]|uniref:PspA/IM30 family protein n=1 Tax=Robertmurraya korlensis TaxID=519977 RepID=UPI00203D6A7D|nr:PspA/IM30 family protein [Robertmurraya korlensis]MCM3602902.1 PspA/IM30 family protein [Robertmurraya korlensis]